MKALMCKPNCNYNYMQIKLGIQNFAKTDLSLPILYLLTITATVLTCELQTKAALFDTLRFINHYIPF